MTLHCTGKNCDGTVDSKQLHEGDCSRGIHCEISLMHGAPIGDRVYTGYCPKCGGALRYIAPCPYCFAAI